MIKKAQSFFLAAFLGMSISAAATPNLDCEGCPGQLHCELNGLTSGYSSIVWAIATPPAAFFGQPRGTNAVINCNGVGQVGINITVTYPSSTLNGVFSKGC